VDPILSVMDGDSIKTNDVRRNLDPLAQLARELDLAVILVHHWNKGSGNARNKISGSHAFTDTVRSSMVLDVDEETGNRILTVDKSNYAANLPSYAYDIDTVSIATDDGEKTTVGRARPLGESVLTVHDIIARRQSDDALGATSTEIVTLVNKSAPKPVTVKEIADEMGIEQDKARTYLGRLEKSGRIARTGRGEFSSVETSSRDEIGESTVSPVANATKTTHSATPNTHIGIETTCSDCGQPLDPALVLDRISVHSNCEQTRNLTAVNPMALGEVS
jgi:hypothetical protein